MDKYDKVLELIEHPEKYTDRELEEILRDSETRDLYNTLCDADSALREDFEAGSSVADEMEISREWNRLMRGRRRAVPFFHILRRRAVAMIAIAVTSAAALALGIGIVDRIKTERDASPEQVAVPAAPDVERAVVKTAVIHVDTISEKGKTTIYENEPLSRILSDISGYYGLTLEIQNEPSTKLRLYYKWDSTKDARTVVGQLNNFEKINLSLSNDVLSVK